MELQDVQALQTQVLWAAFAVSAAFGASAQRTHFCTMGAIGDIVNCQVDLAMFHDSSGPRRLKPMLDAGNVEKTMSAPVTAIVGTDLAFYDKLPYLFPHTDARSWFAGKSEAELMPGALRNSSLQGAYLIIAARALGLDCGPMGGFDSAQVDATFFAGTAIKSSFLINLGYGRRDTLFPRSPRLAFADACSIV